MPRWIWSLFLCLSTARLSLAAVSGVELRNGEFRLTGWTGGPESALTVYAGHNKTPMLGTYSVEGDALVFHPRFPLVPGIGYHGTFPGGTFVFDAAPVRAPEVRVEHIYPSADTLPANTLKLYILFAGPMNAGDAWEHIHLTDGSGNPVPDAFLDQELWDPEHKRLTVLFDPGRIKRGLVPAKEAGTPIVEGGHYILEAYGERKAFIGGPSDRRPPNPSGWHLAAPKAGTREPFVVTFPKPMDFALLQRMLTVDGIAGTIEVADYETEWRFVPDKPWKAGRYQVTADSELEDIAGNKPFRAFDVDLRAAPPIHAGKAKRIAIPFQVR